MTPPPADRHPDDVGGHAPGSDPLAALATLLRGTHLAPPERIGQVMDLAAGHLGARAVMYLVDHAMETLVPVAGGEPLRLDSTLPGLAYRRLEAQTTTAEGRPRMWIPVLDGVQRLGVLELTVTDARDLEDPDFLHQAWLLTHYLGHILDAVDRYGDGLEAVRRRQPRNVAAELVWQLLPPLTAATDKVIVSGRLEPADTVGGDVFDYALSEERAEVAIFDATGHDLTAGLAAATALSAYRNARREGGDLHEQGEAVHRALVEQFGDHTFATGVLASLDLATGDLRYLAAGHPSPLVLRNGRVVKSLDAGRRPIFGLAATDATVGEEQLEPGDLLVLYTDGITEARDAERQEFGLDRLVDFVERQYAEGTPLPEVVRGLCKTILDHQKGVLQDDSTVVLLHWTVEGQLSLEPVPLR